MQDLRKQPLEVRLSALLDGEVAQDEQRELERLLSMNGDARDLFERLKRGSETGTAAMDELVKEPVPLALVRAIKQAPPPREKPGPRLTLKSLLRTIRIAPTGPQALAAGLFLFLVGGGIGYLLGAQATGAALAPQALAALPAKSWLDDIAAYHRVYSRQQRHLAEVPASDADHIVEWLTESVGVSFALPDLTGEGLQFRGARLLVAEGKPVGELLSRNDDDDVIAICFMKASNKAPGTKTQGLDETIRDDIGLISWTRPNASYVVVGPSSEATLTQIAEKASSLL